MTISDRLVQKLGERGGSAMVEVQRDGDRLALRAHARAHEAHRTASTTGGWASASAAPAEPTKDAVLRYGPLGRHPGGVSRNRPPGQRAVRDDRPRLQRPRLGAEHRRRPDHDRARRQRLRPARGRRWYLSLLALLSLSLGILNLLPIPILDGGHLLYYLIELVKGSPVSERVMAAGQYVGLALIAGLMGLAFYNDIVNNLVR